MSATLTPAYVLAKTLREKGLDRLADEQELVILDKIRNLIEGLDGDHISVVEFVDAVSALKTPVVDG